VLALAVPVGVAAAHVFIAVPGPISKLMA